MSKIQLLLPLAVLFFSLLSGCASTVGAFFNRPVVEDDVGGTLRTISLSADRRTVIVAPPGKPELRFCAEPPPDTATALKTDLDASAAHKGVTLGLKDKFETSVTVLSARNAPLDAFRTGTYALCQFYLNGAIEKKDMKELFTLLLTTFRDTQNLVNEVSPSLASNDVVGDARKVPGPATATATQPQATTVLQTRDAQKK